MLKGKLVNITIKQAYWGLAVILIVGLAMRVVGISKKSAFSHDESISYLDATGHMQEFKAAAYDHRAPYNIPVAAKEWKRLSQPEKAFVFGKISRGIAESDMNSPFYYWTLHVFCLIFGTKYYTGLILNVLLSLAMAVVLFQMTYTIFKQAWLSVLATLLFLWSPAVLHTSFEARGLAMLGLVCLLYMWQVIQLVSLPKGAKVPWLYWLFLILLTALGMLTQVIFITLVAGAMLLQLLIDRKLLGKRMLGLTLVSAAGGALFALLHPVWVTIKTYLEWKAVTDGTALANAPVEDPLALSTIFTKTKVVIYSSAEFFAWGHYTRYIALVLLVALILGLIWKKALRWERIKNMTPAKKGILFFLIWNFGTMAGLYILGFMPPAVGEQYYMHIWPLLAIVIIGMLRAIQLWEHPIALIWLVALIPFSWLTLKDTRYLAPYWDKACNSFLQGKDLVVFDSTGRGELPRLVSMIPDDQAVLIAETADLYANFDQLNDPDLETISFVSFNYKPQHTVQLLAAFEEGFDQEQHSCQRYYKALDVYVFTRK